MLVLSFNRIHEDGHKEPVVIIGEHIVALTEVGEAALKKQKKYENGTVVMLANGVVMVVDQLFGTLKKTLQNAR